MRRDLAKRRAVSTVTVQRVCPLVTKSWRMLRLNGCFVKLLKINKIRRTGRIRTKQDYDLFCRIIPPNIKELADFYVLQTVCFQPFLNQFTMVFITFSGFLQAD